MLPSPAPSLRASPTTLAYLNCAYMSPLMKPVIEAGATGLARKAHPWELTADKIFAGLRGVPHNRRAELFDCSADCIAIVPSASYGMATAARNLPIRKGRTILLLAEQFPSNYYPWQRFAEEVASLEDRFLARGPRLDRRSFEPPDPQRRHRRAPARAMD